MVKITKSKIEHSYLHSIELEGIGCFKEKQFLDLSDGKGNYSPWTLILGDNGTGKTTLLRVIDRLQPIHSSMESKNGEVLKYWLPLIFREKLFFNNRYEKDSNIKFEIRNSQGKESLSIRIFEDGSGSSSHYHSIYSNFLILSYGASRRMSKKSLLTLETNKQNSSSFDDTIELINAEEWYFQKFLNFKTSSNKSISTLFQNQLEVIKSTLIEFLPDVLDLRIKSITNIGETTSLEVKLNSKEWVNLRELSYGYQTMTALLVDISSKMMDKYPESKNPLAEPVIILIDEIDLHLHPKWQRLIIEKFSEYFPKAQFIVTSHSPLIVQAAKDVNANIVVCRKEGDHVVIDNNPEEVQGWRVDQILISDLFDSPTVRSKNDAEKMNKYYSLKAKSKLTKKEEAEVQELSQYLKKSFESDSPISDTEKKINQFLETHLK